MAWMGIERSVNLFAGVVLSGLLALPVHASSQARDLMRALKLDDVIQILRDEGLEQGRQLGVESLGLASDQSAWTAQVSGIYDLEMITGEMETALDARMTPDQMAMAAAFFDAQRGQRILDLETAARLAMADEDVENAARDTYADLSGTDDALLDQVSRFVEVNDLLGRNVRGILQADFQFMLGLVDGGAYSMDEGDIIDHVWSEIDTVREDTESWLFGYLLLAYGPLGTQDLEDYIGFSQTEAGRALNEALFAGFDAVYRDISYALGLALARAMSASDL